MLVILNRVTAREFLLGFFFTVGKVLISSKILNSFYLLSFRNLVVINLQRGEPKVLLIFLNWEGTVDHNENSKL